MKIATRYLVRCMAFITANALILSGVVGCSSAKDSGAQVSHGEGSASQFVDEEMDAQIKASQEPYKVAESGRITMYINGADASVTLRDTATGHTWDTNPASRNADPLAQGVNRDYLNSQILLEYVEAGKSTKMDSYSQSIALGQFYFYPVENGIGVNYLIGKKPHVYVVPRALSVERYEQVKASIKDEMDLFTFESYYKKVSLDELATEADKALFLKVFPILKERPIYYFDTTGTIGFHSPGEQVASDFLMEQVEAVFVNAGYTEQDMQQDHKENKVNVEEEPDYSVALRLEYRLEGETLSVTVPHDSIQYSKKQMQLVNIWVTPYFGAADNQAKGYMLVPGGSGSLIYLNNGKTYMEPYETELLYGEDPLFAEAPKEPKMDVQAHLPVFGMKNNRIGFVGVIESGDGSAFIEADVSGRTNSFNHVCPRFQVSRPQHQDAAIMNLTDFDIYPEKDLSCDLQIRYLPLQNEQANYSGMANAYREYLIANKKIKQNTMQADMPFHLRTIGAVTYKRSILGIPVDSPKALTTYEETVSILEALRKSGVQNLALELSDWANGGRENSICNSVDPMGTLGGKKGFKELLQYVQEGGISFFPGMEMQTVAKDKWFDGFDPKKAAARTLNKRIAYNYDYKLSSYEKIKGSSRILVSPGRYDALRQAVMDDLAHYGIAGVSVKKLGSVLYSDYNPKKTVDRQQSIEAVSRQLSALSEKYAVLAQGANAYALPTASLITDIPLTSEHHYMCDESIPFYQMVVHGLVPVAGSPLNYSDDFEVDKLRLIETGSIPSFEFIYRDNYELKDTKYNIYGVNYKLWMEQATAVYKEMNSVLKDCQTAKIVRHETVADGVKCTTYDNGVSIVVNYTEKPVTYRGQSVAAKGYIRLEGENRHD